MTLFTVSNKTWLNVEGILSSWSRAKFSIASAGMAARGSTQREIDWHQKTIGMYEASYANFARNTEDRQIASGLAF
jgi:hypothetical protein